MNLFRPNVLAEVEGRLTELTSDSTAQWGKMSPHQAVCHLADTFRMVLGDRSIAMKTGLLTRTAIRFFALTLPLPWPKNVATAPELDQARDGTTPAEFQADVDELKVLMAKFVAPAGQGMETHPIFGNLTAGEWGRWGYRHLDHHLRQFGV